MIHQPHHLESAGGTGSRLNIVLLILGAVGIGLAPLFVRWSEVGVSATGFWRLAIAFPMVLAWGWVSKNHREMPVRKTDWILLFVGGGFFAVDLALWHTAIRLTSVANATLETNLSAVLVPIFAWLFWRQRIRVLFIFALVIALLGVVLLVGKNARLSPGTLRGDLIGGLSAFFYSGYLLSTKAARDRGIPTAIVMTVSGLMTALGLLLIAGTTHERIVPASGRGWLVVLALAVVSQLGGQCLIAYSLVGLSASFAAVGLLVQPATAALAAWLFLRESLAPGQLAGAIILTVGIYLSALSRNAK